MVVEFWGLSVTIFVLPKSEITWTKYTHLDDK